MSAKLNLGYAIVLMLSLFSCNDPVKKDRSKVVVLNTGFNIEITKVSPVVLKEGDKMNIKFTLNNGTNAPTSGFVGVSMTWNDPARVSYNVQIVDLAAYSKYDGSVEISVPKLCEDYKVYLTYFIPVKRTMKKRQKNGNIASVTINSRAPQCTDSSMFGFHPQLIDNDHDLLDDNVEKRLLAKFRPFLKFSSGDDGPEDYRPVDLLYYISNSTICFAPGNWGVDKLKDPNNLLLLNTPEPSSDLLHYLNKTNYRISPNNDAAHGNAWNEVQANKNFGLFGHVVPILLDKLSDYNRTTQHTGCSTGATLYYKIEYWQFFGYNNAEQLLGAGNHDGDWETVQLLVNASTEKIASVFYYAHGTEMRFDMASALNNVITTDMSGLVVQQFIGPNFSKFASDLDIHEDARYTDSGQYNNMVRFTGSGTDGFTHPVVYLEHGSHEFFPNELWRFGVNVAGRRYYASNHKGDQQESYLTENVPNLGEVGFPLGESPAAKFVLHYNGDWGCDAYQNSPPPGPTLHYEWTWLFSDIRQIALYSVMEY